MTNNVIANFAALITKRNKEREEVGGVNLFHVANEVRKENRGECSMPTNTSVRQAVVTAPGEPVKVRVSRAAYTHVLPKADSFPLGYEAGVTADQWEAFLAERAQEERDSWAVR